MDYDKIRLGSISELADCQYVKAGYTNTYGLISFYNAKQELIMTIQIIGGEPETAMLRWLNYLGLVVASDKQKEADKKNEEKLDAVNVKVHTEADVKDYWDGKTNDEVFTEELLIRIFGTKGESREYFISQSYPYLKKYMDKFGITTPLCISHFLAQIGVECKYFESATELKENLNYTECNIKYNLCKKCYSCRTKKCFDCTKGNCSKSYNKQRAYMCNNPSEYAGLPEKIADVAYGGFMGRGFIHLTSKDHYDEIYNYRIEKGCSPKPFLQNPIYLSNDIETAAMSACAFFESKGCILQANKDNFDGVTNIVNLKDTNREDKKKLLKKIKIIMNIK